LVHLGPFPKASASPITQHAFTTLSAEDSGYETRSSRLSGVNIDLQAPTQTVMRGR